MSGASVPGTPLIFMGRTEYTSFGMTSALNDISDLWQEEIIEKGDVKYYKVDGELRTIKTINEEINIKGAESIKMEIGFTHRGPLMSSDLISESSPLFGGSLPKLK